MPMVDISGRNQDEPIETIPSIAFEFHPDWQQDVGLGFDLALLKLERDSCTPFPVPLASEDFDFTANGSFIFVGFGREDERSGASNQLQFGDWEVIPQDMCEDNYIQPDTTLTDEMFCARGETAGLCTGDDGGPLVWREASDGRTRPNTYLVGIGSFTDVECTDEGASFFTSIPKLMKWINETVEANS